MRNVSLKFASKELDDLYELQHILGTGSLEKTIKVAVRMHLALVKNLSGKEQ